MICLQSLYRESRSRWIILRMIGQRPSGRSGLWSVTAFGSLFITDSRIWAGPEPVWGRFIVSM
jgi:hypothetical protein